MWQGKVEAFDALQAQHAQLQEDHSATVKEAHAKRKLVCSPEPSDTTQLLHCTAAPVCGRWLVGHRRTANCFGSWNDFWGCWRYICWVARFCYDSYCDTMINGPMVCAVVHCST